MLTSWTYTRNEERKHIVRPPPAPSAAEASVTTGSSSGGHPAPASTTRAQPARRAFLAIGLHANPPAAGGSILAARMTISDHAEEFAGLPIRSYGSDEDGPFERPEAHAWKLSLGYEYYEPDEPLTNVLARFLAEPGVERVKAIVIGTWEEMGSDSSSAPLVEALVAARSKLPALTAIFLADVVVEECEISWIGQSDVGPLLKAYPALTELRVRGGQNLRFGIERHPALRSLVIESGGLSSEVVREVAHAELPELTHLELWLGDDGYGASWRAEDLQPILEGTRLPRLRSLGLRDSDRSDEVAAAVAVAPITQRLKALDLSLGTLGDEGAQALVASVAIKRLEKLDLHHHYLSDEMVARLRKLGPSVNLDDPQEADDGHRYVAVSE